MAIDAVPQDLHQPADVGLQADPASHLHEVLAAHLAVLGVVEQQVRELAALLHQVDAGEALHFLLEAVRPEQLAEDDPGVVEAQRLIESLASRYSLGVFGLAIPSSFPPKVRLNFVMSPDD